MPSKLIDNSLVPRADIASDPRMRFRKSSTALVTGALDVGRYFIYTAF
jgi:hypothetical protein